jgi:hypothetical protein
VNIPTLGSEFSHELRSAAVQKWDKRAAGELVAASLPECAVSVGRFSKTRHWLKCLIYEIDGKDIHFSSDNGYCY